ncbi:hypothetical protein ACEWY4_012176 [Coilia grayii]|uniref:Arrestin-like N-terminal domain-containing protein n=1 Tax=Coilia grayii TaxID=363190 RepID=A0ABD1JZT4_9TELE
MCCKHNTSMLGTKLIISLFKLEHFFVQDTKNGGDSAILQHQSGETYPAVVSPGCHEYPFRFQIPQQDMPSSFDGQKGKVVYSLKAKLSRRKRLSSKETTEFTFVSRTPMPDEDMNETQSGTVEKKIEVS